MPPSTNGIFFRFVGAGGPGCGYGAVMYGGSGAWWYGWKFDPYCPGQGGGGECWGSCGGGYDISELLDSDNVTVPTAALTDSGNVQGRLPGR
jgi:hypothetical protein